MSREMGKLLEFMKQLEHAGMRQVDILPRSYDFALYLFRATEEQQMKQGDEISSLLQVQLMDRAADLLKFAVIKGE